MGDLTNDIDLGDVAATSLLTIYCHALETMSKEPILDDQKSVEIVEKLDRPLSTSENRLHQALAGRKIKRALVTHIALRAKRYDEYAADFLRRNPEGVVVNIGCGLDYRFPRVDNGSVRFYDLDLPEVIALKKRFVEEGGRYHMLASSVLDHGWFREVSAQSGPFLFMAEGVFMYLPPEGVKALVLAIQRRFPGSELVCEVFNSFWLRNPWRRLLELKLQKEVGMGGDAMFKSGVRDGREIAGWGEGIEYLGEWSYFDSHDKKLGMMRLAGKIGLLRRTQWTVRYRLR
jgi:methyltransferase (TIGR00027 family)